MNLILAFGILILGLLAPNISFAHDIGHFPEEYEWDGPGGYGRSMLERIDFAIRYAYRSDPEMSLEKWNTEPRPTRRNDEPGKFPRAERLGNEIFERLSKPFGEKISTFPYRLGFRIGDRTGFAYGEIILGHREFLFSKTEDEIAFAIAHELGHFLLGNPFITRPGTQDESLADQIALELMDAANFDVRASILNLERSYEDINIRDDPRYPTLEERISKIQLEIEQHKYERRSPTNFAFRSTRAEIHIVRGDRYESVAPQNIGICHPGSLRPAKIQISNIPALSEVI